jgi:hypothetical protein
MNQLKSLVVLCILSMVLWGCEDKITKEYTYLANVPVYMSTEEFKSAVKKSANEEVKKPGKIYIKDNYLFVNEANKGIHVYNNSNPSNPVYVCFINIPGNVDMAIKGHILYADSYTDLVAIDIANPENPYEVDRQDNAFPNYYPAFDYGYPVTDVDPAKGIVVGWNIEEVTAEQEQNLYYYREGLFFAMDGAKANSTSPITSGAGVAGSMARFAISEKSLYAINNGYELKVFDISGDEIVKGDSISIFWNIETLFTYDNKLFIGSNNGMFIYDISDSPHPVYISQYNHITSCDPVVVQGEYAFVTLRSGTNCRNTINELNVVSLEDIKNPVLLKAYPMYNPHGLGIDNNLLFICDGDAGLKVYDASDIMNIDQKLIKQFDDIKTFDVIPYNNILIMTGNDGIFEYDYSDPDNIVQISHIALTK